MNESKVEFETMIDIAYCDCLYDIKHLQIFGQDAYYEEKFSNVKFKIVEEKFKELLEHHIEGFKSFEKFSKEKGLGNNCYLEARFDGQYIFIPLYYFNKNIDEETRKSVDRFIKVVLNNFLTLCRTWQITLDDVAYKIKTEIKALNSDTEFSMREIFSKYADFFWNIDDAFLVYKSVLNDLKLKIDALDKFGDKFVRIKPDELDFDFLGDSENKQELDIHKHDERNKLQGWNEFVQHIGETPKY